MREVMLLHGAEPRKILQTVIEKKTAAIMSYLSRGKWHIAKVLLSSIGAERFNVEVSPRKKPHPINIRIGQPVGISLKYGYGKFIFETTVVGLEPSAEPTSGGMIVLAVPDRIEIVQRRNYYRVNVPGALKVDVALWHRCRMNGERRVPPSHYWQGKLVDISAGGAQVAVDAGQRPDFKKGQFIGLRFTPMPYEMPLMFSAQIRSILPTADGRSICVGLQMVGLEASSEGRGILRRLCDVVERYYQMNRSGVKQMDCRQVSS